MRMKLIAIALGVLGVLLACYLIWPEWFGFCETRDRGDGVMVCDSPFWYPQGVTLLPLALTFLPISLIALALSRKTFKRWAIFSVIYGLVVWGLLAFIPEVGGGFAGMSFTLIDIEGFAKLYAGLFAILSLALFFIPDLLSRRKN